MKDLTTKRITKQILVLTVIFVIAEILIFAIGGAEFKDDTIKGTFEGFPFEEECDCYSTDDSVISVEDYSIKDGRPTFMLKAQGKGTAGVVIINGVRSAIHEPEYDIDYIIILGCAIKKDGTLYPLIRGRVDKAIAFYKKQTEATGKKAVFVPSGGQGSDEIISEGEAMKRYLLEQGIPEEQIMAETNSKNTAENMRFSRQLIEEKNTNAKLHSPQPITMYSEAE